MSAGEINAVLQDQVDELSPKDAMLKEMVIEFHENNKQNVEQPKTCFDKTQGTGRYTIEIEGGYDAEKHAWLRTLAWQCMKKLGQLVPLYAAADGGEGAGGPAAAPRPNALLNGEPCFIAFPSLTSRESTDLDDILTSVFRDMNGTLVFTYDNIESSTERFARQKARELDVSFNPQPHKAPIWYNEMMMREVIHGICAPMVERLARTVVGTYEEDQNPDLRELRNSMVHTIIPQIPNTSYKTGIKMTQPRMKEKAREAVDECLKADDAFSLYRELEGDGYRYQFCSQEAKRTLLRRTDKRASKTTRKLVLPKLDKKQAKSNSTRAAKNNPKLILMLTPQQAPPSVLTTLGFAPNWQALKTKLKEAGLQASVTLVGCTRRQGLDARTGAMVEVTPNTGSSLKPICKFFEQKNIREWLKPLVESMKQEDDAPPGRKRRIEDSEDEDDIPLAVMCKRRALRKTPTIVDLYEENDKPSFVMPVDNAPRSVREPTEIMADDNQVELGTGKNNAACRSVLAAIDIEDTPRNEEPPSNPVVNTPRNEVPPSNPVVNTAGNHARPKILIPKKKASEQNEGARVSCAKGDKCSYKSRMGWWKKKHIDTGEPFWEHYRLETTTVWERLQCRKCRGVIWENLRSGKTTTECPWGDLLAR